MSTPKHRKQPNRRVQGGGSSLSLQRTLRPLRTSAAERALSERRRKSLTVMSWLSLSFALVGLILSFIPAGFVFAVTLFLIPSFVMGILALALRSDRVWSAVAGVVVSVVGGHVAAVSMTLVVVLAIGGISLPSLDLSSLTKGLNLSGLQLPDFKIPDLKIPSINVPKIGGFGSPSASDIAKFTQATSGSTGKNSKTSPTPTPTPGPTPTPDPTPTPTPDTPTLYSLDDVIVTSSGIAFSIVGFECGFDSITTEHGDVTPNGEYCEAHVVLTNTGSDDVDIDTGVFVAIDEQEEYSSETLVSGFWKVDEDGTPLDEDSVNEDGASIGPKMLDPLTLSPSEHAVGVISFDVELTRNPKLLHVEGSFVTDAVIVSLGR